MNINIHLSEASIERAISKLEDAIDQIMFGSEEFVDIMLMDGEEVANMAYGDMATAWGHRDSEEDGIVTGHIGVSGEDDNVVYIAEFGAGDDTVQQVDFENKPPVDVYAGAYSEQVGTGEYAEKGYWHWHGMKFYGNSKNGETIYRVEPRHGLLNAKAHILASAGDIAKEVIHL